MSAAPPEALVLSIGEELLDGRVLDRNAGWLAERLRLLGVPVREMRTIGDAPGALHALLQEQDGRVPLILSSGGLGPTVDDRVRLEAAAAALGEPAPRPTEAERAALAARLLDDIPGAVSELATLWERQHQPPAPSYFLDQGRLPPGSRALRNEAGTAWGFAVDLPRGTRLICHPGPPVECHAAWHGGGRAQVQDRLGEVAALAYGLFHTVSIPESAVEARIRDLLARGGNPRLGITAHGKLVTISVLARDEAARSAAEVFASTEDELRSRLGDALWGRDHQTQAEVVVEALRERGQTLATAESCTGGALAAALTTVPGASAIFGSGWVCYANEAKTRELSVPASLLEGPEAPGAVSAEVAAAMAAGARAQAGADWGLGITGIAGPDGGTPDKPVGTVYLGLADAQGTRAILRQQWTRAGRAGVQAGTVRDALEMLRRALLGLAPLPERRS